MVAVDARVRGSSFSTLCQVVTVASRIPDQSIIEDLQLPQLFQHLFRLLARTTGEKSERGGTLYNLITTN